MKKIKTYALFISLIVLNGPLWSMESYTCRATEDAQYYAFFEQFSLTKTSAETFDVSNGSITREIEYVEETNEGSRYELPYRTNFYVNKNSSGYSIKVKRVVGSYVYGLGTRITDYSCK